MVRAEILRQCLQARAESGESPYLRGQDAFYAGGAASGSDIQAPWCGVCVEQEFFPSNSDVTRTKLFAFGAGLAMVLPRTRELLFKETGLLGFPEGMAGDDRGGGGFRRLLGHAQRQLRVERNRLFVGSVHDLVDRQSDLQSGIVLRLSRLLAKDVASLGALLEDGRLDAVVGLDLSQPDLSEDTLYRSVRNAVRGNGEGQYVVRTDIHISSALTAGERTGLFRRDESPVPPRDAGYEVASCYALIDDSFPAVTVDLIARHADLSSVADRITHFLCRETKIEQGNSLLRSLFTVDVAVPDSARLAMIEVTGRERDCVVRQFYERHRVL